MKRTVSLLTLMAALAVAAAWSADRPLPAAWKYWQFSAAIAGPGETTPALWSVVIASRVSARSRPAWGDLRVLDSAGTEVPHALHARKEKRTTTLRAGRLFDLSFKPGESTQGIVDLGPGPGEHNSIVVETDEANYFTHVELAISNDASDWRLLRDRSPIYRFAAEQLAGNQTVHYSLSRARYLRVRILQAEKKFLLTGVRIMQETIEEAEVAPLEALLRRDASAPAQQSWWGVDLGHPNDPVSSVRFAVEQPEFHRAVRVSATSTPENPRSWRVAGEGDIYRYRRGDSLFEKLTITVPEQQSRHWRVEVFNRNDPELAGFQAALYGTPRRVIFSAKPGTAYRLIYGNTVAHPASYEMARLVELPALEAATPATLGAEEANPEYEDPHPRPWTERNPVILWGAVLLAVAVLGALAVRALRTS